MLLREEDTLVTAFQAKIQLSQFQWMPFGISNGVAGFQRTKSEGLKDVFIYVDNINVCGRNKKGHDQKP